VHELPARFVEDRLTTDLGRDDGPPLLHRPESAVGFRRVALRLLPLVVVHPPQLAIVEDPVVVMRQPQLAFGRCPLRNCVRYSSSSGRAYTC
jgi:hypothetical protein